MTAARSLHHAFPAVPRREKALGVSALIVAAPAGYLYGAWSAV
ncbi:MAG: hypothetical protein OXU96_11465 [Gammaproteobacteria bacterium]|nr:hypothetical protein [Gammaproteobacteria bacterium]